MLHLPLAFVCQLRTISCEFHLSELHLGEAAFAVCKLLFAMKVAICKVSQSRTG